MQHIIVKYIGIYRIAHTLLGGTFVGQNSPCIGSTSCSLWRSIDYLGSAEKANTYNKPERTLAHNIFIFA